MQRVELEVAKAMMSHAYPTSKMFLDIPRSIEAIYSGRFEEFSPGYAEQFTFQNVLRYGQETLVFAAPYNGDTAPTAVVYSPRTGGRAEPVCVFERRPENY